MHPIPFSSMYNLASDRISKVHGMNMVLYSMYLMSCVWCHNPRHWGSLIEANIAAQTEIMITSLPISKAISNPDIHVQATRHAEFEAVDELLAAYGGDCQAANFPE